MLHVVLGLLALEPAPYAGGDNAAYAALGRSILTRGDYTEIWDPSLRPGTLYPPLFPLILAGAMAAGLQGWVALKTLMVVLSAAAVGVSTLWLARLAGVRAAAAGSLVLALSPGILAQTHTVLSEIPFWGLTFLALLAFAAYESRDDDSRRRWLVVAALATALAWLTRSAGMALGIALIARLLLVRRWRDGMLLAAIAVTPVFLWWLRGRLLAPHGYTGYLLMADPYRPDAGRIGMLGLVPRALENGATYLTNFGPSLFAGADPIARAVVMTLIVLAIARWGWRLVRERGALEIWVLLYTGMLLVWPQTWAGERFVVPLAPALVWYALDALRALVRRTGARPRLAGAVVAGALLLAVLPGTLAQVRRGVDCRREAARQSFPCTPAHWRDLFEVAASVRGVLPEGSVVIARKPSLFFDLSGYRSAVYPWSSSPEEFFAVVDSTGADYVLLDRAPDAAETYLVPVLEARPDDFCVVEQHSRPLAVLLRIDRAAQGAMVQDGAAGQVRFRTCGVTG